MGCCPVNDRWAARPPLGALFLFSSVTAHVRAKTLPGAYFPLLEKGGALVQERLNAESTANLRSLEECPSWSHFPYAILAPAVLYAKKHPQNLKPGEVLETGSGKKVVVGSERLELDASAISGLIRHHGLSLKTDSTARLVWPVYPHNPYSGAPETSLRTAVAALSVPLTLKHLPGVRPREQEILFTLSVP
jgi:hypothetical protein